MKFSKRVAGLIMLAALDAKAGNDVESLKNMALATADESFEATLAAMEARVMASGVDDADEAVESDGDDVSVVKVDSDEDGDADAVVTTDDSSDLDLDLDLDDDSVSDVTIDASDEVAEDDATGDLEGLDGLLEAKLAAEVATVVSNRRLDQVRANLLALAKAG